MTAMDRELLWQRLLEAGLAHGDMPATAAATTPWYVRLMLGAAGWIGAVFFVSFLGGIFVLLFRSGAGTIVVGMTCCGGAYALFRLARDNDFVLQFGLAASLAGQLLVIVGLFNLMGEHFTASLYLLVAAFEVGLIVLIENFAHRVWSTMAAAIALSLALADLGAYNVHGAATGLAAAVFAAIWLNEHVWIRRGALWRPVGYGVAIALLWFDGFALVGRAVASSGGAAPAGAAIASWIGAGLSGAVLVYAVARLLASHDVAPSSRIGAAALATAGVVAVITIGAPGVAASLLILIVGFAVGQRVLQGIGVLALLGYLSYFYYSLHVTLLTKSAVLMGTGVVLIAAWFGMRQLLGDAAREDAHA